MSKNTELKEKWELLVKKLSDQFADGDSLDSRLNHLPNWNSGTGERTHDI